MNSIIIEILRNDQATNIQLSPDTNYIAIIGSEPSNDLKIECTQQNFNDNIILLRYNKELPNASKTAIAFFQDLITKIFDKIFTNQVNDLKTFDFLHLRFVTKPKEIAQLPFEMALPPTVIENQIPTQPFFINENLKAIFTRELRQSYSKNYKWPSSPRILFAWAQPVNRVPHKEHVEAFVEVLKKWALPIKTSTEPVPDVGSLISLLPDATLQSIKRTIRIALDENKPYTHIHLLAHGVKDKEAGSEFLLQLNNDNAAEKSYHANGNELGDSLIFEREGNFIFPQVVSLMVCDSGNVGDPVHPTGSLAHSLHQAGIPCVFASQFPLTQDGSIKLIQTLYGELLQSSDPRIALYNTRVALAKENTHDWASLVAYARFPEDIDEQMKDIKLKIMLEFMKTANALTDHILKHINQLKKEQAEKNFIEVEKRLDSSIDNLTTFLKEIEQNKINKDRFAEHYGLIGSAYKRKAEHIFRVSEYNGNLECQNKNHSINALLKAKNFYNGGYKFLNSHWNGTQYLSLATILKEQQTTSEEQEIWTCCKVMAENDERYAAQDDQTKAWAYGTLAELYFLKPYVFQLNEHEKVESFSKAQEFIVKLNNLTTEIFPKQSTVRQFDRYINWWPKILSTVHIQNLKKDAEILQNSFEILL
jgi:CHAT domain